MWFGSYFFFSSRRRHTRFDCDWSSDVCSSDLVGTNDGTVSARNTDTGSYLLTLAKGPGTFATSPGDEGGDLTNGATHAGTIYLGDLDQWSLDRKSVV